MKMSGRALFVPHFMYVASGFLVPPTRIVRRRQPDLITDTVLVYSELHLC